MTELTVSGLVKSFGSTPVLRGLDLTVPQGGLTAVLGPSGCGKTTLLRLVAGFESPDAGQIVIDGTVVAGPGVALPPERRRVGVVPQEGALFPHLTVAGNVAFGLPRARRKTGRVADMLDLVGLGSYGNRMPHELSGGQQQRVALARALAPGPALVLLDEPFSALDTGLRQAVREDVRTALHTAGATAVLVTHDQQEALSMADVVSVLRAGRIVQAAAPDDLYTAPADMAVATFVGEAVVLDAVLGDGFADCVLGRLPIRPGPTPWDGSPAAGPGTVVIRPEQIVVNSSGHGVRAHVTGTRYFGHDALIDFTVLGTERRGQASTAPAGPAKVVARVQGSRLPRENTEVGLTVAGEVSFFRR